MAKIKITENELKQVIRESVSEVLTEGNFGMNWDQLTDAEKQKFTNRYNNWNLRGGGKGINSPEVQRRYQTIQARKQRHGNATLSQAQGQRLQTSQNNLNSLYSQLGIDIKTPEKFGGEHVTAAQTAITDLKNKAEQLVQVQKELETATETIEAQKNEILSLRNQLGKAKQSQAMRVQNNQNAIQRNPANNNLQGPGLTAQARVNPPQTPPLGTQLGAKV